MIAKRITLGSAAWSLAALAAMVLAPALAQACPVCMGGAEEEVRKAFILTTALLTAFPLLLIGATVWWLVRRLAAADQQATGNERVPHSPQG